MGDDNSKIDEEHIIRPGKQADEHNQNNINPETVKKKNSFSNFKRELSDVDFNSP